VTTFTLKRVHYMPKELEPGLLYVSEQFEIAGHICACGCGNKVMTPLGPTEWRFEDSSRGPTLTPSIGSWQLPCKSHYWITRGEVRWAGQWSPEQIEGGRLAEDERRRAYYVDRSKAVPNRRAAIWRWVKGLFSA
jgi:uncharacterized protein DUF6527